MDNINADENQPNSRNYISNKDNDGPRHGENVTENKNLEDDNNKETFYDAAERDYKENNEKNYKADDERLLMGVVKTKYQE